MNADLSVKNMASITCDKKTENLPVSAVFRVLAYQPKLSITKN